MKTEMILQRLEELKSDPAPSERRLHRPQIQSGVAHGDTSTPLTKQSTSKFKAQWAQLKERKQPLRKKYKTLKKVKRI